MKHRNVKKVVASILGSAALLTPVAANSISAVAAETAGNLPTVPGTMSMTQNYQTGVVTVKYYDPQGRLIRTSQSKETQEFDSAYREFLRTESQPKAVETIVNQTKAAKGTITINKASHTMTGTMDGKTWTVY